MISFDVFIERLHCICQRLLHICVLCVISLYSPIDENICKRQWLSSNGARKSINSLSAYRKYTKLFCCALHWTNVTQMSIDGRTRSLCYIDWCAYEWMCMHNLTFKGTSDLSFTAFIDCHSHLSVYFSHITVHHIDQRIMNYYC